MKLVLTVRVGEQNARKLWISPGQSLSVGSSDLAELALPGTPLRPLHFQVRCEFQQAVLQVLDSEGVLELNGRRVQATDGWQTLGDGDRVRIAGVEFGIEWIGQPRSMSVQPQSMPTQRPANLADLPARSDSLNVSSNAHSDDRPSVRTAIVSAIPTIESGVRAGEAKRSPSKASSRESLGTAARQTEHARLYVFSGNAAVSPDPTTSATSLSRRWLIEQAAKLKWKVGVLIGPGVGLPGIVAEEEPLFVGTHLSEEDRERLSPRLVLIGADALGALLEQERLPGSVWCSSGSREELQSCLVLAGQGRWNDEGCPRPEWMLTTADPADLSRLAQAAPESYLDQLMGAFQVIYWDDTAASATHLLMGRDLSVHSL